MDHLSMDHLDHNSFGLWLRGDFHITHLRILEFDVVSCLQFHPPTCASVHGCFKNDLIACVCVRREVTAMSWFVHYLIQQHGLWERGESKLCLDAAPLRSTDTCEIFWWVIAKDITEFIWEVSERVQASGYEVRITSILHNVGNREKWTLSRSTKRGWPLHTVCWDEGAVTIRVVKNKLLQTTEFGSTSFSMESALAKTSGELHSLCDATIHSLFDVTILGSWFRVEVLDHIQWGELLHIQLLSWIKPFLLYLHYLFHLL